MSDGQSEAAKQIEKGESPKTDLERIVQGRKTWRLAVDTIRGYGYFRGGQDGFRGLEVLGELCDLIDGLPAESDLAALREIAEAAKAWHRTMRTSGNREALACKVTDLAAVVAKHFPEPKFVAPPAPRDAKWMVWKTKSGCVFRGIWLGAYVIENNAEKHSRHDVIPINPETGEPL